MDNCIFCKIYAGLIPSAKIYEDEKVFAFLDLHPARKGHTLLIPKVHAATLLDLPSGFGEPILSVMARIGNAQMKALGSEGFNCIQNNFSASGQEVMHLHWHIIPRFPADGLAFTWNPSDYDSQHEMLSFAQKLNSLM